MPRKIIRTYDNKWHYAKKDRPYVGLGKFGVDFKLYAGTDIKGCFAEEERDEKDYIHDGFYDSDAGFVTHTGFFHNPRGFKIEEVKMWRYNFGGC